MHFVAGDGTGICLEKWRPLRDREQFLCRFSRADLLRERFFEQFSHYGVDVHTISVKHLAPHQSHRSASMGSTRAARSAGGIAAAPAPISSATSGTANDHTSDGATRYSSSCNDRPKNAPPTTPTASPSAIITAMSATTIR